MATDIIARGMITEYKSGTNINFTENEDGSVTISASGNVSSEDTVARDTIDNHKLDKNNPHNVTAEQVGLNNVDNTADLDKPISTAVQTALDDKANAKHTHKKSDITDFPNSLPANGGNADTVNNHTVDSDVPTGAVFTDTVYDDTDIRAELNKKINTADIKDNLESTDTTSPLSANQGKVLNEKIAEHTSNGNIHVTTADKSNWNGYATEIEQNKTDISTVKTDIQNLQTQDNVLSSRIDNLSTLSEGSTTGDAELIDMRVGADGTTYENAGTAVRTQVSELKQDLAYINEINGELSFSFIRNSYYKLDGTYENYDNWSRTPFLTLPNTKKLVFDNTSTEMSKYNCFYDENRKFISSFSIWKGHYDSVDVPPNAKFVGFSGETAFLNGLKVSFYETGENVIREKLGIPTRISVCSFNVGLWTDGVPTNARVADEDVPNASVTLRRFIGNINADFILCEEATPEFNKSMTIDAFEQCFENNLPYGWKTSESGNWNYVRQMLMASKYKIENAKAHEYKCGSERGYATFDVFIDGKCLTFIVCHLSTEDNSEGLRQQEMEELKYIMQDYEYSILCGDFNAYSIDEFTNHFGDCNIANHGYFGDFETWNVEGLITWNHCLDNIITTKNITIENVYMGNVDMSDHKPLIAEMLIN